MSQDDEINNLRENLSYIERFEKDLSQVRVNLVERYEEKSYDNACEEIFNEVRARCVQEVEKLKSENSSLAQYAQDYSNELLKIITRMKEKHYDDLNRKKYQDELISEILNSTGTSKDFVVQQIEELEALQESTSPTNVPEPGFTTTHSDSTVDSSAIPPVRTTPTGKKIRNVGQRPPVIKKRK